MYIFNFVFDVFLYGKLMPIKISISYTFSGDLNKVILAFLFSILLSLLYLKFFVYIFIE